MAGGRFTKPAESRYSPVEGELLAVADALFKARHFVLGCDKLIIAVDRKPLLGLFIYLFGFSKNVFRFLMIYNTTIGYIQVIHKYSRISFLISVVTSLSIK